MLRSHFLLAFYADVCKCHPLFQCNAVQFRSDLAIYVTILHPIYTSVNKHYTSQAS